MGQKITIEAALAAFRKKCGELLEETVLLKARVTELEEENAHLRGEPGPQPPMEGQLAEHG